MPRTTASVVALALSLASPALISVLILALALASAAMLPACAPAPPEIIAHVPPTRTPDATYTVRARVVQLPGARRDIIAYHEPIDNFKNQSGEVVGMNSMKMDFPIAKGLEDEARSLILGSKIEMTFSVWWGNTPLYITTDIKPLPADTEIREGRANPAAAREPAPAPAP
jgi:hypothetical protein